MVSSVAGARRRSAYAARRDDMQAGCELEARYFAEMARHVRAPIAWSRAAEALQDVVD